MPDTPASRSDPAYECARAPRRPKRRPRPARRPVPPARHTSPGRGLRGIFEERIEHRHGEQRQEQAHRLTAGDQNADRSVGLRARPAADTERQHAGNQRQRRHQDRAQPIPVGLDDRFVALHAFGAQADRVIDLQDGVLLHDAEEQEHAERRVDVQLLLEHQGRQQPEGYGQREGEQDRHRVDERLELRRQHHVHEDERQRERDAEVIGGPAQFARLAAGDERISRLHVERTERLLDYGLAVRLRSARRRIGADRDLPLAVQTLDRCRSCALVERDQVAKLHQLAGAGAGTVAAAIESGVRR